LQQYSRLDVTCAVPCAGCLFDESLIEQGRWSGIPLAALLEDVTIDAETSHAVLHGANGYSTSLSLAWLRRAVLALEQDGRRLGAEQGFPARLIVPGLYGYKMPRWLTRIELTNSPIGFWEERGWSGDGAVPTFAAITFPHQRADVGQRVTLAGVAFSGQGEIASVELSVDDADWMPVDFSAAPSAQLVRWQTTWSAPSPGEYHIRARAMDESSGARNILHGIVVQVAE
jgi:DMSO/TMAO reductase YedYZ molybdopterin-dependent catalytic subunit